MSTKQSTKKTVVKKTVSKKTSKSEVAPPVVTTPVVQAVAPTVQVKGSKKPPSEKKVSSSEKKVSSSDKKARSRRVVTRESLEEDFNLLQKRIEDEIEKLRGSSEKVKGVKFLRSVNKLVKVIHSDSLRVLKIKPKTNRVRSSTSGFMKPVGITPAMASFTGWDVSKLCSRVDVTKFICKYIRENNLQNSEDRRQILVDDKLKALLNYDPSSPPVDKKTGKPAPLTYFRLQQYIQPHFVKTDDDNVEEDENEEEE